MLTYDFDLKNKSLFMKNMQKLVSLLVFFIVCPVVLFARELPLIIDKPGTFELLSWNDCGSYDRGFTIPGEGRLRFAYKVDPMPAPAYSGAGENSPAALGSGGGPSMTGGQAGGATGATSPPCPIRELTISPATFNPGHREPAGSYDVYVSPSTDQRTASEQWRKFGPYNLLGGRKYLFVIRDGAVDGPIENDSRLNRYPNPSPDTTATYYENRSESQQWKAVTICPAAPVPPVQSPCAIRELTIRPATFNPGHREPAGSYDVCVSPSADQRTASGPWRKFGPYNLLGGRKYLFVIRDGAVDGPIENDSRLNRYPNPSPDTTATYYENRSESQQWKAVTICPAAPVPPVQSPCAIRELTIRPASFNPGHKVPAGSYDVCVSPSTDQRTASGPWRKFGPYNLLGGRKYLFIIRDGAVDGPIENDSRLNRYPDPSPDTTATYYENRSESQQWKAVTICPAAPPPPVHSPCAGIRYLTIRPASFNPGHKEPAGSYFVYVSPSADQRTASGPWRKFGPFNLLGGRKYLFIIRDGAVDGPIENDSRLNRYPNPSPDTTATYYENRSESQQWLAVTICPGAPLPPQLGPEGTWKNTDHIHQGCKVVESFCKAYKVDVLFSKEPDGALKGQLVGQQVFMVGYLQGQTWKFSTTMNGLAHGNGYFEFSPDFKSFKGELSDANGDHHVVWTGKR